MNDTTQILDRLVKSGAIAGYGPAGPVHVALRPSPDGTPDRWYSDLAFALVVPCRRDRGSFVTFSVTYTGPQGKHSPVLGAEAQYGPAASLMPHPSPSTWQPPTRTGYVYAEAGDEVEVGDHRFVLVDDHPGAYPRLDLVSRFTAI
jgi:hypothetical protein